MDIAKHLLPFLEQYPLWFRAIIAAWLVVTVSIMFLFVPRSTGKPSGEGASKTDQTTKTRSTPDSHFAAVHSGLLSLDCQRYRAEGHPDIHTSERLFCEVLSELRSNISIMASLRDVLYATERELPSQPLRYGQIKSFVERSFAYEEYGPKKESLLELIGELEAESAALKTLRNPVELKRWDATGTMTLDDLFIATGFLEWLVGYQARGLPPSELFKLGPFFHRAFGGDVAIAVRRFRHADGTAKVAYLDVLTEYD